MHWPCYCTVHVVIHYCHRSFCGYESVQVFFLSFVYICIAVGDPVIKRRGLRSSYQEERVEIQLSRGEGWDPINRFNPATLLCLSQTWISNVICGGLFMFSEFRWEVILRFVDIGEIDDHHCLNFLFIIVKVFFK